MTPEEKEEMDQLKADLGTARIRMAHLQQRYGLASAMRADCAEFVLDDGRRFAWSESNVRYEEVPADDKSFTTLRLRLRRAEAPRECPNCHCLVEETT